MTQSTKLSYFKVFKMILQKRVVEHIESIENSDVTA